MIRAPDTPPAAASNSSSGAPPPQDNKDGGGSVAAQDPELRLREDEKLRRLKRAVRKPLLAGYVSETLSSLLGPTTWIGIARLRSIDLRHVAASLAGAALVPAATYKGALSALLLWESSSASRHRQLIRYPPDETAAGEGRASSWLYLIASSACALSATALYCRSRLWEPVRDLGTAWYFSRYVIRSTTLPEAWECLADRVAQRRAYRSGRYDAYLPSVPKRSDGAVDAVLFLPGAGVEDVAYARVAAKLSDEGYVVVVVSAEPMRMASPDMGYTARYCRRIMRQVENQQRQQQQNNGAEQNTKEWQWYGAGHSLGSFTLTHIAQELGLGKLVFWGCAPFVESMKDISDAAAELKVRVVQGTDDVVVRTFSTPEKTAEYWKRLPGTRQDVERVIVGGTHSGFASYQSSSSFAKNETGSISRHEQHRQVVRYTVEFLSE